MLFPIPLTLAGLGTWAKCQVYGVCLYIEPKPMQVNMLPIEVCGHHLRFLPYTFIQ